MSSRSHEFVTASLPNPAMISLIVVFGVSSAEQSTTLKEVSSIFCVAAVVKFNFPF